MAKLLLVVSDFVNAEALQMQGFFFARWFKQKLAGKLSPIAHNFVLRFWKCALAFKEGGKTNGIV